MNNGRRNKASGAHARYGSRVERALELLLARRS
jgi:hypothetical protein